MEFKEQIQRILENVPKVYEAGRSSIKNEVANALKGSASGEAVALKDVSPIEHNLGVRVESKNLAANIFVNDVCNATYENGVATQIKADSYETIYLKLQVWQDEKFISQADMLTLTEVGIYSLSITIPAEGNMFMFGISGKERDTVVKIDITDLPEGTYTVSANFINITQGSISWCDIMLNRGTEAKPYTPHISDLSAVKLKVQGANLLPPINATVTEGDVTAVFKDGYVTFSGSVPSGGSEHISYYIPESDKRFYSAGIYRMGWMGYQNVDIMTGAYSKDYRWLSNISSRLGATISEEFYIDYLGIVVTEELIGKKFPLMLKLDTDNVLFEAAKEYEPYKEPIEYSQGEDIKSIYPSTTIMTDTEGALITVEYNIDLNEAFAKLYQAIISLGGNV